MQLRKDIQRTAREVRFREKTQEAKYTTLAHEAAFTSWLLVIKKMNAVADISLDLLCVQLSGRDPPGSFPHILQSYL